MEYADLCFVYDFFYCNTTFLFDHHDHSLKLKEQPVYVTHLLKLDWYRVATMHKSINIQKNGP